MELMGLFLFTQLYRLNPTLRRLCATSAVCARLPLFVRDFRCLCATLCCLCATFAVRARLPLFVRDFRRSCATSAVRAPLPLFVRDFTPFVRDFPTFLRDFRCLGGTSADCARL